MNTMTLRSARDGWHYGIDIDDPELDSPSGLIEGDGATVIATAKLLVVEHNIRFVDIREDVDSGLTVDLAAAMGRKLRSNVRPAPLAVAEEN